LPNEDSHDLQRGYLDAVAEIERLRTVLEDIASGELGVNVCIRAAKQALKPNEG
jgi:hypothetical protein